MWFPGLWDLFWKPSFPANNEIDLSKAQGSDRQEREGRKCVSPIPTSPISYKICMKAFKKVFLNNTLIFFNLGGISFNNNMKKVDWRMAISLHALTFEIELRKPGQETRGKSWNNHKLLSRFPLFMAANMCFLSNFILNS